MDNRKPQNRAQRYMSPEQEYQANRWIRSPSVRLIDEEGTNVGVVPTQQALDRAKMAGMDLITIAKDAEPPVCRIYDLSKYSYEQKKLKKEQDKKNRENAIIIKELQIRPSINEHDLAVKQRHADEWLEEKHKIKIVMRFRGREMAFTARGFELLNRFISSLTEHKIEKAPSLAGNTILAILAPVQKSLKT